MDWENGLFWIVAGVGGLLLLKESGGDLLRKVFGFLGLSSLGSGGAIPRQMLDDLSAATGLLRAEAGALGKSRETLDGVISDLGKSAAHQHDMATVAGRFACYDCLAGWLAEHGHAETVAQLDTTVAPKLFCRAEGHQHG